MIPLQLLTEETAEAKATPPVFSVGFRPFFLGASLFAVVGMVLWMAMYIGGWVPRLSGISPVHWHAHEMIYGYGMAVIAGFLLTAVRRWTHLPTADGWMLAGLFGAWALARIMPFVAIPYRLVMMALFDLVFCIGLIGVVLRPIHRTRQWKQMGILAKLITLGVGNALFYAGALGWVEGGVRFSIYMGLYLVVALIIAMGRRIIPPFIEVGLRTPVRLKNWRWVDVSNLVFFLLFFVLEVFTPWKVPAAIVALLLFGVQGVRLYGWYTPGMWRKPLSWSLYVAYMWIVIGFLLYAGAVFKGWSPYLAVHAFAMGGIGVVTLSMMIRVSLGHTGRAVLEPPRSVGLFIGLLVVGVVVRVILPLFWPEEYVYWIFIAQVLWISAFGGFFWQFLPVWVQPAVQSSYRRV